MNIFLHAPFFSPGGPNEVNRNLVRCLRHKVLIPKIKNNKLRYLVDVLNIIRADVVVFSGLMFHPSLLKLSKMLGRKVIYIMHGCMKIETGQNCYSEDLVLSHSDLILCVSKTYRNLMAEYYPPYAHKMEILLNGVNWQEFADLRERLPKNLKRDRNRIVLFGGGRPTKKNLYVCRAVQQINEECSENYHVDVYGYFRDNDDSKAIAKIPCVTFHHVIPHDLVNIELSKSQLFIQNSEFEPFSLAVMDALQCGCDLLFSRNVGAQDIINGKTEHDIIQNPINIEEIKEKIKYVMLNSNNKRLIQSVDKETSSIEAAAANLLNYCMRYGTK